MDHPLPPPGEDFPFEMDLRPFSEQRAGAHRVSFARNPDRLIPSLAPGAGSLDVTWPVERHETWYCDSAVNPLTHPHIAPYLYSSSQSAREHSKQISTVDVWFAGRAWAIVDVSTPVA